MGNERRLHARAIVRLAAELRKDRTSEWQDVLLHDLSAGGACVHAGMPLAGGSEVGLRIRLPATESAEAVTIELSALMVRSGTTAPPDLSRPYLYGLHFLDLHGDAFDRVGRYVWNLLHAS